MLIVVDECVTIEDSLSVNRIKGFYMSVNIFENTLRNDTDNDICK